MQSENFIGELMRGKSVAVVGPSNVWKSHWVKNVLIPKLEEAGKFVQYSKDGFTSIAVSDIAILDEAEALFDAVRLQEKYPDDCPYYSEKYLQQIADWYALYVISRKEVDVQYMVDNFRTSDWDGRKLKVFRFS